MTNLIPDHGILRMWCDLYGPKSEAPVEGHLGAAMCLISAAIGHKAALRFGRHTEPASFNIILEGPSAIGRKTTTANTARELARQAIDDTEDDPGLYVHNLGHTSDAGILELIAPKNAEQAKRWNDHITPPGHMFSWDEFGSVLGDPGENRKGGDWLGRVRTTILNISNGWHSGSKTRSSPIPACRCSVSILATMTSEELEQRISTGLLHDGFMGRFALIPMKPSGRRLAIPPEFTDADLHREREIVNWLRLLAARREEWGDPFRLMTPSAIALRIGWYDERHADIEHAGDGDDDLTAAIASAFGRLQALAMKIATVHAVCRIDDPATQPLKIDNQAVAYGQDIADLCLAEITRLAGISGPSADQYQDKVVAYLERVGVPVSKRELLRIVKYRALDAHQRWRIVEDMHPDPIVIEEVPSPGPKSLHVRLSNRHRTVTTVTTSPWDRFSASSPEIGDTSGGSDHGANPPETGDSPVPIITDDSAQPSQSNGTGTTDTPRARAHTHLSVTTDTNNYTHTENTRETDTRARKVPPVPDPPQAPTDDEFTA